MIRQDRHVAGLVAARLVEDAELLLDARWNTNAQSMFHTSKNQQRTEDKVCTHTDKARNAPSLAAKCMENSLANMDTSCIETATIDFDICYGLVEHFAICFDLLIYLDFRSGTPQTFRNFRFVNWPGKCSRRHAGDVPLRVMVAVQEDEWWRCSLTNSKFQHKLQTL